MDIETLLELIKHYNNAQQKYDECIDNSYYDGSYYCSHLDEDLENAKENVEKALNGYIDNRVILLLTKILEKRI